MRVVVILVCCISALAQPPKLSAQAKRAAPVWACGSQSRQAGHLRCTGNVEFTDGDVKLYADELDFLEDDDRVVVAGNVVFTQGKNQVWADKAEFNRKTRLGTFYGARGVAPLQPQRPGAPRAGFSAPPSAHQDNEVRFEGDVIEKVGPKTYRITNGGFTTCLQPAPRWQLDAGRITLNIDDYTLLHHAVFSVKNVPLFYLPILYYPTDKDDRSTGFLLPTYGSSTLRGQTLTNRFFWAIDRSQDATFRHDLFSKTGHRLGAEYRYALANGGATLEGFLLNDRETTYSTGTLPAETSYYLRANGVQRLPGGLLTQLRVDYPSSIQTARTATLNITDLSLHQRTYGGNITRAWRYYAMNGTFERTEYFTDVADSVITGRSPRVALSSSEQPVFGRSGLYASFSSEVAYNDRQTKDNGFVIEDRSLMRFDFSPRLRYPFKRWQWLTLNSSLLWRETFWSQSQDPVTHVVVDDSLNRQFLTLEASAVGPVFNRVWDTPDNGYAEKFKHTIEPFLRFTRTSFFDRFDQIINVDSIDAGVGGTTSYAYGINNRLSAKRRIGESSQAQEIVAVTINQTYYTDERASLFDANYYNSYGLAPPSKFSPVQLSARVTPTPNVNATVRAEIDSRTKEFRSLSANTSYGFPRGSLTGGWTQRFALEGGSSGTLGRDLNFASALRAVDNRVGGSYSFNLDAASRTMRNQTFAGYYNAQCCGVAVQYQLFSYGQFSPIPQDKRFFVSFTLAGLGSFSPFDGALGAQR
jgi:LPS-assembly protein